MAALPGNDLLRGANTQWGFVAETAPNDGVQTGDAVAWFLPLEDTIGPVIEKTDVPDMGLTDDGLPAFRYVAKEHAAGELTLPWMIDSMGMLLAAAMGGAATSGAGPYTHTFALDVDNPATLGAVRVSEDTAGTTYEDLFGQFQVPSLTVEAAPGGIVRCVVGLFGNLGTQGTTPATQTRAAPTPSATQTLLSNHSAAMSWNGNTYEVFNWKMVVERTGLGPDQQYVSSVGIAESYISGNTQAYFEVDIPASDYSLLTAARGTTQSDASLVFTVGSDTVTFSLENAEVATFSEEKSGMGPKMHRVRFSATGGGSYGARIVVVNSETGAVVTQNTAA